MEILLFMAGAMLGFIIGSIFGMCQMDSLHRRVKGVGGYAPVDNRRDDISQPPRSMRPTPPGAE